RARLIRRQRNGDDAVRPIRHAHLRSLSPPLQVRLPPRLTDSQLGRPTSDVDRRAIILLVRRREDRLVALLLSPGPLVNESRHDYPPKKRARPGGGAEGSPTSG